MSVPDHMDERSNEQITAAHAELSQRSTKDLFAATLHGDYDDDLPWDAVHVLRLRNTAEVFNFAKQFCESDNPRARARGLDVLAQLGSGKPDPERPYQDASVAIALNQLHEPDLAVVNSAAWALSHLGTQDAIAALIELRNHTDPSVRQAVASCIPLRRHPYAAQVVIALMDDEDEEVRDWATFALGSDEYTADGIWCFSDSPEIRAALRKRLDDSFEDARREAIWGLAKRKDPQGLNLLIQQLESDNRWSGDEMAAEEILNVRDASVGQLCEGLRQLLNARADSS